MPKTQATILVVDDELEIQPLLQRRLHKPIQRGEFKFIFATNAQDALQQVRCQPDINVVLTDLNMPGMDGFAFLEKLSTIDPFLKAVVVSAYGDLDNIRAAMNRGAFDFITKPINFQDLKITIEKTVKMVNCTRQQQQQLDAAKESLHFLAHHDPITGLPNQNALLKYMRREIANHCPFAVLFLNLNRFGVIKYGFGDTMAEQFLFQGIEQIKRCLQPAAMLARVWKDEFAILLPGVESADVARKKAAHIHASLGFSLGEWRITSLNSPIGIALSSLGYEQAEDYLRAADTAMHYAKLQAGNNNTMIFNPQMQEAVLNRLQLESEIEQAINNQQFCINYQPIINLQDNTLAGFEALLRWQHPTKGKISPADFIPIAEETGLIIPLGNWVLWEASRQLKCWQEQYSEHFPLFMSVNLSGIQLLSPDIPVQIDKLLQEFSVAGSKLKLEITESVLMSNTEAISQLLEQFKSRQIELSIDDFGTGYSSLSYLQSLPLDTLKIDRSFVKDMESSQKSLDIVKTIITLAHSLGLDVIAEGVETEKQLQLLQELGCEFVQGYYFSPPLKAGDCTAFLRGNTPSTQAPNLGLS